jgi:dTDP-4-dehydrorhamnose reductase
MKVVVVGKKGQVARSLAERAAAHPSMDLTLIGRPELDLEIPGSAAAAIERATPDVVVNAAAYTVVDDAEDEPERALRINGEAAGEIATAAAAAGAAMIQLSTDYVFDGRVAGGYDETARPNPLGVYGRSKLQGEDRVRAACPRHAIVRTAWVFSPFGHNFVKTMMAAAHKRDVLTVVDDQVGSPTSALDLADGLLALIDRWAERPSEGVGETYHLAGSGSTSWCGFASAIMDECRARGRPWAQVEPIATEDWPTNAARPRNSVLDSTKFERTFDFAMRPWQDSMAEVVARVAEQA